MFFFDLFGAPPSEIIKFCKKRKDKHLHYNNSIIQDLQSEVCGFNCLGLLFYNKLYRNRFTSLNSCCNSFINLFENETKNNADILKDFFHKFYFRNKEKLIIPIKLDIKNIIISIYSISMSNDNIIKLVYLLIYRKHKQLIL